ncbi:MAG: autoinducer binding domain-containing protein [Paracoccaceae bacterium]
MKTANTLLRKLHKASPAGFAIGLHIQYTTPRYFFQSYKKEWFDIYSAKGYVMQDPSIRWGFSNEGTKRWSELADEDTLGVLVEAAQHGVAFGTAVSVVRSGSRTIAGFARSDREMTDLEIASIHKDLRQLHDETLNVMVLSPEFHETMRQMSIYLTHG